MSSLTNDSSKTIAVFINDFRQEFAVALDKLSERLGRPLQGIVLIDSKVLKKTNYDKDEKGTFKQIVCDFSDETALRAVFKSLEKNLLLVTGVAERNQLNFQQVLPHVPYVLGPTERSLDWATHKAKMRAMLGSYNPSLVPKVQEVINNSEKEIQKVLGSLQFPVIVKPTGLAASVLVSKAHDEAELRAALDKSFILIRDIYKRDRGRGKPSMIVEEFIEGDMYTVDAYVNEIGTVWTLPLLRAKTAYAVGREGFNTYQTDSNLEISKDEVASAYDATIQAIHALGLRSCVAHVELYHTETGWKIIELGARAGGLRQDIYAASHAIDHAYNELLIKVGLAPEINDEPIAYAATFNIFAEEEGVLSAIEGLEELSRNQSLYTIELTAEPGHIALLSQNGGRPLARGVMQNISLEQVNKDIDLLRSTLKFITQKIEDS